MEFRTGILMAFVLVASMLFIPVGSAEAADYSSELFYIDQLEENEVLVYKSVSKATSVDSQSKEFSVDLIGSRLFETESRAKEYADQVVQNALSAAYLSNAMIPYLWDYPVKSVAVDTSVAIVKITKAGVETTSFMADKVTFTLSVPEGITAESMKELNDAIKNISVTGKTDADKVKSMMSTLDKMSYSQDEEGTISNIYDALVTKSTTSAGIAQALLKLCQDNNIPCIIVAGENLLASKEPKNLWNYVYLEGDVDGETTFAWYLVDASYATSTGISGYLTEVTYDGKTCSMLSVHNVDLTLSAENDLVVPQLAMNKYVPVGGLPFLELHGEKILIGVIGVVLVLAFIYAIRNGKI